jgi:hypothetical protein
LCLQVCLGKSAQETLLGGVCLPDFPQRRLKSGCLATADGEVMQVDSSDGVGVSTNTVQ